MLRTLLALSFLTLVGCTQAPPPAPPDTRAADEKAIRDGEAAWAKDWEAKDAAKLVLHYVDTATVMAPGFPPMKGKEQILAGLSEMVKDPNMSLVFAPETVTVAKSSDLAYTRGSYTMRMTDPKSKKPVEDKGSYVTVYQKQADGSWKAVDDINTSSGPVALAGK